MFGRGSLAGAPSSTRNQIAVPAFAPSQAKVPLESLLLSGEQQTSAHIHYWDTPFTPLEGDVASDGLVLSVREPLPNGDWLSFLQTFKAAACNGVTGLTAAFGAAPSTPLVTNGRVQNLLEYWSGGAPAWYGATQRGKVAMHWRCVLRPVDGRSWFSVSTTPTFSLAFGGNGYLRVTKTVAGVTSDVAINGTVGLELTETDYLTDGLAFSDVLSTLGPGDAIDIYYIQNAEIWGGLVCKVVAGSDQTAAAAQSAGVLGAGLFDSGAQPDKITLTSWDAVRVTHELGGASQATIALPLINPLFHDGFGYEWRRSSDADDPGYLVMWDDGVEQAQLHRGRLLRVEGGLVDEEYVLFTGIISDFEPNGSGMVQVRCVGFESRPLKAITKNEPDEISYMTFGYKRQKGTSEPVYGVAAYDNWSIEFAIQDLLYRTGIDASRFAAALTATTYDGSSAEVVYDTDAFKKFRARSTLGHALRLERQSHYGNVGNMFDDSKPTDDPYLFKPEDTKEPWSRVREMGDRYGYDVRFDHMGDCVLASRGNASTVVDATTAMAGGTGTQLTHPSAFAGTYIEWSGTENPNVSFEFTGSRIDVSLPRGASLGNWAYMRVVRTSDEFEVGRVRNVDGAAASDIFFYDYRTSTDGNNATILTLFSGPYDTYRVECLGNARGADGATRRLDSFFVYAIDPLKPLYPRPLSTDENAISIEAAGGAADDMRNLVYVVGKRKAAVTDSSKFVTNPNNPDPEFIVQVAVDAGSITDPAAKNYVGSKLESVIYDDSISDPDFAAYLARTFVYRYRTPRPPADIQHTILPVIELRDPLFVTEKSYHSVNEMGVLWATKFTHDFSRDGRAMTTIATSAWPEFPSYEPREDIDIDANFHGIPIANVEVSYTSCTGHTQTNLGVENVILPSYDTASTAGGDIVDATVTVTAGSPDYLDMTGKPWPPVPGTVLIGPPASGTNTAATYVIPDFTDPHGGFGGNQDPRPAFTMLPGGSTGFSQIPAISLTSVKLQQWRKTGDSTYIKDRVYDVPADRNDSTSEFWYEFYENTGKINIHWKSTGTKPTATLYFAMEVAYVSNAGTARGGFLGDNPYHHFTNIDYRDANPKIYLPWKQGDGTSAYQRPGSITSYAVKYRRLGAADYAGGVSPFADVTTSDIGQVCTVTFDALVTGFYRISVRSVHDDTVVAWLTEPTADAQNPDAHDEYLTAGAGRQFVWDYVDQAGVWNQRQSEDYAASQQGVFELNQKEVLGSGWVVWNRERDHGQLAPLALISGSRDALGKPVYGQGTYAAWYVHVEVRNDRLEELHDEDIANGLANPRPAVRTTDTLPPDNGEFGPSYTTAADAAIVYTHMPEPTMAEILVDDWIEAFAYDPTNSTHATNDSHWGAADSDATLHNEKPVRIRFQVKPRPGVLWAGQEDQVQVKVTRHAHARLLVFDQFAVMSGANYPGTNVPQRTIYSRTLVDDSHTITYQDQGWRRAKTFRNPTYTSGTVQWVFLPQDFKKKFREVENEPIAFGDYLQTQELPSWDPHRSIAGASSRYLIGFWGALFYLSAYVQDRSGRRMWCTNRRFLDKSKIVNNTYGDWWDPSSSATPPAAANSSTYRSEWPTDPMRQQRRSVVCRQWTNEGTWIADQTAQWSLPSIGQKLLRHKWADHDPTAANLNGTAWPTLDLDEHSKWHVDGRSDLSNGWSTSSNATHRQLGTWNAISGTTTQLGSWTWETNPLWIPNVSRDFHAYHLIPPMPDSSTPLAPASGGHYLYGDVDGRKYNGDTNEGDDQGAGPTWSSWCRDMTYPYNSSSSGRKRFFPGTQVDTQQNPNKAPGLDSQAHDYVRQDELVHYEDLRGVYSRGPRPAEAPRKVTPVTPYYLNPLRYGAVSAISSVPTNQADRSKSPIPRYKADVSQWFRLSFRSEYIVESSSHFPTTNYGLEYLGALQVEKTRFLRDTERAQITYDTGAWTGWKDDLTSGTSLSGSGNIFESTFMPFQTAPEISGVTKEVYMHLCLVGERRASAL